MNFLSTKPLAPILDPMLVGIAPTSLGSGRFELNWIVLNNIGDPVVEIADGDRTFRFVVNDAALATFAGFRSTMVYSGLWFDHVSQDEATPRARALAWNKAVGEAFDRGRELCEVAA